MLKDFADYVVYGLIGLKPKAHLGQALNFFFYDSIKIFILLSVIIFLVAIVRSTFLQKEQGGFFPISGSPSEMAWQVCWAL